MTDNTRELTPEERAERAQRLIQATAAQLWDNMPLDRLIQLEEAAASGTLEKAFADILNGLAQDVQDDTEPRQISAALSGNDAEIDPNRPGFDFEKYKEAIGGEAGFVAIWEEISRKADEITDPLRGALKKIVTENERTVNTIKTALANINFFIQSEAFRAIKENLAALSNYIQEHRAEMINTIEAGEEIKQLAPFLQLVLEEAKADPALKNYSLPEILEQGIDDNGQPTDSIFGQLIKQARQRRAEYEETAETIEVLEQAAEELPRIKYKKTTEIKTVTDKLSNVFFSLAAPAGSAAAVNGQRQMIPLRYESNNSAKEITLFYDYVYNEDVLKENGLIKKFDDYDFFVMAIMDNLFGAGNEVVSFTKIYNEMGGEGSPTSKQLEPIYHSLLKGLSTIITIDDAEAQKAWKKDTGTYHEIVSPVIPVQIGNERFIANGKIANGFVRINGYSPFMQVARPLGHVTAWDKNILRLYSGRKTKRYYSVMRYLIMQIGWMRNGTRNNKIKYSTLYEYTGDTTTRAQQLTRDMMYRLLDEVFKPADYITAYKEEADPTPGVVLTLSKKHRKIGRKQ